MFRCFAQFSVLFFMAMSAIAYAADLMGTKQTVAYGVCDDCSNGYGRCMYVKRDSIGRYAVCERATVYGCGFGEVGPRFYLPDSAEVHIRREVVETCGRMLTMDGYNWLQRDRIYIDLTYKDARDLDCMPTKALSAALLEAKKAECESYDGSEFFGEVKEKNGKWCISGRCNACESKWRDNLVNAAKQGCCDNGSEPETDRGVCLNPKENPDKGVGSSALYLLPKCTGKVPDYESGTGFCKPSPGSSSAGDASSSSEPSSSSHETSYSSMEASSSSASWSSSSSSLVACFREKRDAQEALRGEEFKCDAAGGRSDFSMDENNCLWGSCKVPEKSSSSDAPSSSSVEASSSGSESNACMVSASKSLLQKPAGYYDDWVYIGKETYGSRHATSRAIKPGTKLFDVLGRAYDKMKARIKQYLSKPAIARSEYETALEFDVHARIIKDSEGNDVHVFVKEDKKNGLRRDSSFYWDGNWEVFEINDMSKEVSLRISSGTRSLRKYDDKDRLLENYLMDEKGDTLISEQYEWKNGRLIRMIENGMTRIYTYGAKSTDTVRVVPSDEGVRSHSGYNGTIVIPDEIDSLYKYFVLDPYGYTYYDKEYESAVYFTSNIFALPKLPAGVSNYFCREIDEKPHIPAVECIRYTKEYVLRNANRNYPYPSKKDTLLYGESHAEPSPYLYCECAGGKYHIKHEDTTANEYIQVMKSGWRYNQDWNEYCWTKGEMQSTYDHEVKHIKNARDKARELSTKYFKEIIFDTERECKANGTVKFIELKKAWDNWYQMEQMHKGDKWKGVTYGGYRSGVQCSN